MSSAPVVIRIEVTDGNSGAVITALERSFKQLGAAGAAAGKKIAEGMAAGAAGATRAGAAIPSAVRGGAGAGGVVPMDEYSVQKRADAEARLQAERELKAAIDQNRAAGMSFSEAMQRAYVATEKTRVAALGVRGALAGAGGASVVGAAGAVVPGVVRESGEGDAARQIAAQNAYNALAAKSTKVSQELGAAFDQAMMQGMGFTASMEFATKAVTEQTAANTKNTGSLAGMGSMYGETRVMMGAATGSLGQMESGFARMLASSKSLQPIMTGLFSVTMIGAGVAMVGQMVYGLVELYDKWMDVDKAVNKYAADAAKSAEQKLFDEASLETANSLLQQTNDQVDALLRKKKEAGATGPAGGLKETLAAQAYMGMYGAPQVTGKHPELFSAADDARLSQAYVSRDKATEDQAAKQHNLDEKRLRTQALINETGLRGYALDAQKQKDAAAAAELQYNWTQKQEGMYAKLVDDSIRLQKVNGVPEDQLLHPYTPDKNAGGAERDAAIAEAAANQRKEDVQVERQQVQELMQIRERALEANLHGVDLYAAREAAALSELKYKDENSIAFRRAIHDEFYAQEKKRLDAEERETDRVEASARAAGLTGIARIQAEGANRVSELQSNPDIDPSFKARQVAAAQQETGTQIVQQEREFAQQVNAISDASAEHQISGFARISAEAQKQLDDLQGKFDKAYGQIDVYAPGGIEAYSVGLDQLHRGQAAISAGASGQTSDLARKNEQETEEIESRARSHMLSSEQQKTAAIEAEYEDRVRKYQESLDQQQISQEDFNRRVLAAQVDLNAQMTDAARQEREKIAGNLRGLMSAHPVQALEEMGQKLASQAGGAILQRAATHFGVGTPGQGGPSIFDRIAGVPGIGGRHGVSLPGLGATASSGMMTIAQAVIHVGSASIIGGGGTGAGTFGGGGGSTWTLPSFGGAGGVGGGSTSSPFSAEGGSSSTLAQYGGSSMAPFGGASGGGVGAGGSSSMAMSPGSIVPQGSPGGPVAGIGGVIGNIGRGVGAARDLAGLFNFGGGAGAAAGVTPGSNAGVIATGNALKTSNEGGDVKGVAAGSTAWGQSMLGGGMSASNTLGAAGAGLGLFSAANTGGFGGMLSGAMSGGQLGMEVGGPIGAAIGAIGGAALGFFGGGEQARVWWLKQGRPRIHQDMDSFQQGGMDYLSAYMDIEQLDTEAKHTLRSMGFAGRRFYGDDAYPEIEKALQKLTREQKSGRTASGISTAEFATGVDRIPRDGMAYLHKDESVYSADRTERMTQAFESMSASKMAPDSGPGSEVHLHVHAIDAKSSVQFLMDNKHAVRSALSSSYGDYGGLADVSV